MNTQANTEAGSAGFNPQSIVQLNKYPSDRYNVLVPVTTMQTVSNLQKIIVSETKMDFSYDAKGKVVSKDIYFEKSSKKYALTKVAGMKLAAAANISIMETKTGRSQICERCIEMAKATGKPQICGRCPHVYDVSAEVSIRVPEPSGGFRVMRATKEIDCAEEETRMTPEQYKRFLPHRAAIAESKAFMRALRAALGIPAGYSLKELEKPFIVARVVPNLDAPEIKDAIANNYLASMGFLFEAPQQRGLPGRVEDQPLPELPEVQRGPAVEDIPEPEDEPYDYEGYPDPPEDDGYYSEDYEPQFEQPREAPRQARREPAPQPPARELPPLPQPERIFCTDCGKQITGTDRNPAGSIRDYSNKWYGRTLCWDCQQQEKQRRKQQRGGYDR